MSEPDGESRRAPLPADTPTLAGGPAALSPDEGPPVALGHYRILGLLGRGGMGAVYKAHHAGLDRAYAIKVMHTDASRAAASVERFLREARAVARIGKHPHIVQIHDVGQEGDCLYFVMDLVEGMSLDRRAAGRPMDPREAADIARRVAEGLHVAHEAGIVHRDLKPSNILLATDGTPLVTDFGLARDMRAESRLSQEGQVLGTLSYMAPEQAMGEQARIGPPTDVYGLGATLYEMLTGRPPHGGSSQMEVWTRVIESDAQPLRQIRPEAPADLETICLKALDRDPARRYASAREMSEDLARFLAGEPILARPVSTAGLLLRRARRYRHILLPCAAALLLVAGLLAWGHRRLDRLAAEARQERAAAAQALDKARRVQDVLVRWGALASVVQGMETAFHSSRLDPEEKRARSEPAWRSVEEFIRATPPDPTSQSAMRALSGWARRLAGYEEEGLAWMRQAADLDPDLPYGPLMEAFVTLSAYLALQPLPSYVLGNDGLEVAPAAEETEEMRRTRERIGVLLEDVARAGVWGEGIAGDFRGALEALRAMQDGRHEAAETHLSDLAGKPVMAVFRTEVLLLRAKVRYLLKRFDEGLVDLEEVGRVRQEQAEVHYWTGMLRFWKGFASVVRRDGARAAMDEALAHFDRALALDPRFAAAWVGRGHVRHAKRDLDGAVGDYEEALRLQPQNATAAYGRAWVLSQKQDLDAAIAGYDRALEIRPRYANALHGRGQARLAKGDIAGAVADYTEALDAQPDHLQSLLHRGEARQRLEDLDGAIEDYTGAIDVKPDRVEGYHRRSTARYALGDYDGAIEDASRALEIRSAYAPALQSRAAARTAKGDLDGAIRDCDEAIDMDETFAQAFATRAFARKTKGDMDAALADYDEAIRLDPGEASFFNNRGRLRYARKEHEAAIADYDEAVRLDPRYAEAFGNRGRARLALGKRAEAVVDFEKAIEVAPSGWEHRPQVEQWIREVRGQDPTERD